MAELPNIKSWLLDVKFELTKQGWNIVEDPPNPKRGWQPTLHSNCRCTIKEAPMNAKKEVWFITDTYGTIVEATTTAPSPGRECSLLEKGFAVYRRYVDLPETRPTTLRNLQAEENANLRKQVAEGKERMAELRAECDRLTSAPVSQFRADLDLLRAENAMLAKNLQGARESVDGQTRALTQVTAEANALHAKVQGGRDMQRWTETRYQECLSELGVAREACHAEAKLRQSIANELSSVKDQLRGMTGARDRTTHSLDRCRLMLNDARSTLKTLTVNDWNGLYDLLKRLES